MDRMLKAFKFADTKHCGQVRKVSGDPYISHPMAVSYIVAAFKKSKHLEDLLIACYLHDTLEDTDTTFVEIAELFGPLVSSLVYELTSDKKEIDKFGKLEYLKKKLVGISNYGLVIKLADRLHNISDHPTQKMIDDTRILMMHLKKNRKLTGTQKRLVKAIEEQISPK